MTLFYKCLCSKQYEEWRQTWSTSNIKRQYKKIHSRSNEASSANARKAHRYHVHRHRKRKYSDAILTEGYENESGSETSISRESDFSSDSDYESCKIVDGSGGMHSNENSDYEQKMNKLDKDVLLNKIINGQKDDVDLTPVKYFNSGIELEIFGNMRNLVFDAC